LLKYENLQLTDRPGALVGLSTVIADQGANIFEVVHHRIGSSAR